MIGIDLDEVLRLDFVLKERKTISWLQLDVIRNGTETATLSRAKPSADRPRKLLLPLNQKSGGRECAGRVQVSFRCARPFTAPGKCRAPVGTKTHAANRKST